MRMGPRTHDIQGVIEGKGIRMSQIDMSRRNFVKECAALAMGTAVAGSFIGRSALADEAPDWTEECDIVVCGAGGAGMTAAIKAREAGANVIVLEKEAVVGDNTKLASSNFTAAGAQVQKDAEIEGATPDALYDKLMNDNTDSEAIRILADNSGAAADFFTSIGMDLSRCWATFNCGPADGSAPGMLEVDALENRMNELGIDCRLESLAKEIVRDDTGAVEGIVVEGPTGEYAVKAPVVVIASGGFAANADMVAEYDSRWEGLTYSCGAQATGEGTVMAIAAGAAVSNMDNTKVNPTTYYLSDTVAVSLAPIRLNGGIMVATNASADNSGKRIVNEEGEYTPNSEVIMNNGGSTYMVFDQALLDEVAAIQAFNESGYLLSADTLDELADQMDVDKEAFLATCGQWTQYVADGEDPDFGKTNFTTDLTQPPFYAVLARPAVQGTFGGMTTDTSTCVLDESGAVIPGLYACGECADDGTYGSAPTTVNVVFGTIAAESAVEYIE